MTLMVIWTHNHLVWDNDEINSNHLNLELILRVDFFTNLINIKVVFCELIIKFVSN